jgi:hypothetical protein
MPAIYILQCIMTLIQIPLNITISTITTNTKPPIYYEVIYSLKCKQIWGSEKGRD